MIQQFHLKSLELTNFMKFDHKKFDLSKDLNLVIGRNGSGKSSTLEALALSFQLKERGSSVTNYIRKGTQKAEINLECIWLGKPLTIQSVFSKTGSRKIKRLVTYDGQSYEDTLANEFLAAHFEEQHNIVSFALQGDEKFVTTSKTKNLQNLISLLQIDFNKEIDNVKSIIKEVNLKKDVDTQKLNAARGSLKTAKDSLESFKINLDTSQRNLNSLLAQPSILDDVEAIDKEILDIKIKLSSFEEIAKRNLKTQEDLKQVERDILAMDQSIATIEQTLSQLNTSGSEVDFSDKETLLKTLKDDLQMKNISLKEGISKTSGLMTQIDSENKRIALFHDGFCPTCLQKLADDQKISFDNKLKDLEKSKEEADLEVKGLNETIKTINNDITATQSEIEGIKLRNSEISHNNQLKVMHENSLNEKRAAREGLIAKKAELQAIPIESIDEEEKVRLANHLESLNARKSLYNTWKENKIKYEGEINNNQQYIATFEKNITDLEMQEKLLEESLTVWEAEIKKWTRALEIFTVIPKMHLENVVQDIKDICNEIVREFGYKELKMDLTEKGLEFILCGWPLDDVEDADISYEMCSKFEKNLVNISLIYALSNMFKVPFVCIDELDANSDEINTNRLGKLILKMLETVPVVAVSHDPKLMESLLQESRSISILKMEENNEGLNV